MCKSMCISEKHFHFDRRATSQAGRYPAAGFHPPLWAQGSFVQPDQEICVSVLPQTQSRYKVGAGIRFCKERGGEMQPSSGFASLPRDLIRYFSRQVVLCFIQPARKLEEKPFVASLHTRLLFLTPTAAFPSMLYPKPGLFSCMDVKASPWDLVPLGSGCFSCHTLAVIFNFAHREWVNAWGGSKFKKTLVAPLTGADTRPLVCLRADSLPTEPKCAFQNEQILPSEASPFLDTQWHPASVAVEFPLTYIVLLM